MAAMDQATGPADLTDALLTKGGSVFAVSDRLGDVDGERAIGHGLYFHDTRFLSRAVVRVGGRRPRLLTAGCDGDRSVSEAGWRGLRLRRERRLEREPLERIEVVNPGSRPRQARLELEYDADFGSLFAVRSSAVGRRGRLLAPTWRGSTLELAYQGADGRERRTRLRFDPAPVETEGRIARYRVRLEPGECRSIEVRIELRDQGPDELEVTPPAPTTSDADRLEVRCDDRALQAALERSLADLALLATPQRGTTFIAAGLPWFVALFGRDSLITVQQTLAFDQRLAAGTLELLAAHQGERRDPWRGEEPGKILHELRLAEDANLGEVPHSPYYGTVDATPLFVMLLAEYVRWTGDVTLWRRLRPSAALALDWVRGGGDHDGDGFLDYEAGSGPGLANQGWKDSADSIVHRDGRLARPPIALVEVQAYAYRARLDAAWLHRLEGEEAAARELEVEAAELRRRFHRTFWMPRRRFLAMAMAADGRVESIASNAGHALWCGILDPGPAAWVARRLLAPDMFSGWGVRTLSCRESAYDPDDYQVGAVWPHDNSLIVAGLCRYGFWSEAWRVFAAVRDAAAAFPSSRLPEVFGGHRRGSARRPVPYPAACSPQAWAAGSLPYMLTCCLGLRPDGVGRRLVVRPALPSWLAQVELRGLRVGGLRADLEVRRLGTRAEVRVLHRDPDLQIDIE
jgi:glycogen debranching enzyme